MPNTKSAARRVRSNERKHQHNRSIERRLKRAEKNLRALVAAGKKAEASTALRETASLYDRAVKTGTVKRGTADRKKSRLTLSVNAVAAK